MSTVRCSFPHAVGVGTVDFQQTAELYRRFTKSADKVRPRRRSLTTLLAPLGIAKLSDCLSIQTTSTR